MKETPIGKIMELFGKVRDPRIGNVTRHKLLDMLVIAACAAYHGADGWSDDETAASIVTSQLTLVGWLGYDEKDGKGTAIKEQSIVFFPPFSPQPAPPAALLTWLGAHHPHADVERIRIACAICGFFHRPHHHNTAANKKTKHCATYHAINVRLTILHAEINATIGVGQ